MRQTFKYFHIILIFLFIGTASYSLKTEKYKKEFDEFKKYQRFQIADTFYNYNFMVLAVSEVKPQLDKTYTWYIDNTIQQTQGNYSGKLLHGTFSKYFCNTKQLAIKGNFKNGLKNGSWYEWQPDGKLISYIEYEDGIENGYSVSYNKNGKEILKGNFEYGLRNGEWTELNAEGNITSFIKYKKGKKNGNASFYNENGTISSNGKFKNGEKSGKWKKYGINGNIISEEQYKKGKLNGKACYYDSTGIRIEKCNYKNDLKHGKSYTYINGKKQKAETYENGIKQKQKVKPEKKFLFWKNSKEKKEKNQITSKNKDTEKSPWWSFKKKNKKNGKQKK